MNKTSLGRDTHADLEKLADAFFAELMWLGGCPGAPGIDPKRPFGNSDAEADICSILQMEPEGDDGSGPCWASWQLEYAGNLYRTQLVAHLKEQWWKYRQSAGGGK